MVIYKFNDFVVIFIDGGIMTENDLSLNTFSWLQY